MTRNPFANALAALLYIAAVVTLLWYGAPTASDSFIVPVTMLCLLVLSVLMMGYTLLLEPLRLCFESKLSEATTLLTRTIAVFGGITAFLALSCACIG